MYIIDYSIIFIYVYKSSWMRNAAVVNSAYDHILTKEREFTNRDKHGGKTFINPNIMRLWFWRSPVRSLRDV